MLILAIVGAVVLIVVGLFAYFTFHKAPSCTDGKMNNDEEGIDCGGTMCSYLCSAGLVAPSVSFVRELPQLNGRIDVIAYLKNPNSSAAAIGVKYTVELFDANRAVIATKQGVADLAPGMETPVYLPSFFSGSGSAERAFITIDDSSYAWVRLEGAPSVPTIGSPQIAGTIPAPRVVASVMNPFPSALRGIQLVATVFDAEGNAIASSQTVVPELAPQASIDAIFTWNHPFPGTASRIDVRPLVPIPHP